MKKQVYYKLCKNRETKEIFFEKSEGYIYDLTDADGKPFKVALEYERPYWKATELSTGLIFGISGMHNNRQELLKKLSKHNVNALLRKPYYEDFALKLSRHKESEVTK